LFFGHKKQPAGKHGLSYEKVPFLKYSLITVLFPKMLETLLVSNIPIHKVILEITG
jgi:hypothetical protein